MTIMTIMMMIIIITFITSVLQPGSSLGRPTTLYCSAFLVVF
jgi:hypothetical protein